MLYFFLSILVLSSYIDVDFLWNKCIQASTHTSTWVLAHEYEYKYEYCYLELGEYE